MPDEYGEWWTRCNHSGPGITNNLPGDPFVDEGRDFDLTASLYGGGATPYPMMTMAVEMRNRYFWHNAEFARKQMNQAFFSKHGRYDAYQVPGHPKFPYQNYSYWPVQAAMNNKSGKHGNTDIYLHVLGKEKYSVDLLPNGPWDGIVSILLKIDLTVPGTLTVTAVRDAIRNAILTFNGQFSATGSTGVTTDVKADTVAFTKAEVRFSPRFLISNPNPAQTSFVFGGNYANDYAGWQGWIGTHFQMNVIDNKGVVAPAVPVPSAFTAVAGGGIKLGVDSSKAWKAQLTADVQALLPGMLGINLGGAVIVGNDLTPLVSSVIQTNAKVQ